MPSQKNTAVVEDLTGKFERAQVAVLIDYRGLDADETEAFRWEARQAGIELRVAKNRLIKIALKNAECEPLDAHLKEPTMIAFGYDDIVTAPKVITKYIKDNEKVTLKGGLSEKAALDEAGIRELATLPSKDELLGRLVGSLSPQNLLGRMCRSLQNPGTKIAYGLRALAGTKS